MRSLGCAFVDFCRDQIAFTRSKRKNRENRKIAKKRDTNFPQMSTKAHPRLPFQGFTQAISERQGDKNSGGKSKNRFWDFFFQKSPHSLGARLLTAPLRDGGAKKKKKKTGSHSEWFLSCGRKKTRLNDPTFVWEK